jgi:hypothetical protein
MMTWLPWIGWPLLALGGLCLVVCFVTLTDERYQGQNGWLSGSGFLMFAEQKKHAKEPTKA